MRYVPVKSEHVVPEEEEDYDHEEDEQEDPLEWVMKMMLKKTMKAALIVKHKKLTDLGENYV